MSECWKVKMVLAGIIKTTDTMICGARGAATAYSRGVCADMKGMVASSRSDPASAS